jgi:hypothetical protein
MGKDNSMALVFRGKQRFDVPRSMQNAHDVNDVGFDAIEDQVVGKDSTADALSRKTRNVRASGASPIRNGCSRSARTNSSARRGLCLREFGEARLRLVKNLIGVVRPARFYVRQALRDGGVQCGQAALK